jgi:purine-cytosine permease-like protein
LALVGLIGSQPQGSLCIYGAGLGLQTFFPQMSRVAATLTLSVVGLALVFIGIYGTNMADMIIAFLIIDHSALAPWLAINVVGYYFIKRGDYTPQDLFKVGQGRYWYTNGWNFNALAAWIAGLFMGMMFVHTEIYSGPLSHIAGGSLDWIAATLTAAVVYYALERRTQSVSIPAV